MKCYLDARCVLVLDYTEGEKTSKHVQTQINVDVSPNLERSNYLTEEDVPTEEGCKALTHCFVQGLVANIHHSHLHGYRDKEEHLSYIIAQLNNSLNLDASSGIANF